MKTKKVIDRGESAPVLIFDDATSEQLEMDFRGTAKDVLRRLAETTRAGVPAAVAANSDREGPRGPGRPKLGAVAREVTLLPRHWDWLSSPTGGASVALRKLVDVARRANETKDRVRRSQEAACRFMSTMAGNLPGFEEAASALFGGNQERVADLIRGWPKDVRTHVTRLVEKCTPVREDAAPAGEPPEGA
jgi:hypothetical protein